MDTNLEQQLQNQAEGSSKTKYFIWIFVLLIVLAIGYFYLIGKESNNIAEVSYKTAKIKNGDLLVTVMSTGNLNPTNSVDVGIEVSGTIKEIYVDFNDEVKVGQLLAKLDTTKLKSQVDSSKASLAIAQGTLKESDITVQNKKLNYERTLQMYNNSGKKFPSINEVDETRFAYESAMASYEINKAKIQQAEFNLKTDEENLEKAIVKSSINGIVLNRAIEVGQTVTSSMSTPVLFTLAKDLSKMDLIISIDEADVADIKKGLDVTFTVDAYPNEKFTGVIKQVRLNPIESNGVITYETIVLVQNDRLLLRPGMTASAKIITKQVKDKMLIPNRALRFKPTMKMENRRSSMQLAGNMRPKRKARESKDISKSDIKTLWILSENKPKRVRVKVLDTDGSFTAIESRGLKIDDEVIISQMSGNE